jgi:D-alanyl-lipoteichoic acid acyltransferase DltB (MBOAT superfamily)
MLFNSLTFLIFALIFYIFWPIARRYNNIRWGYVVVASFLFYGWWDWRFIFLLAGTGLLDFCAGLSMTAWPRYKRVFLVVSLLGNIGSLVVFKYSGFISGNIDGVIRSLGFHSNLQSTLPNFFLVLPVGISFYTFQAMNYSLDVYKGKVQPTKNVLHFFTYLAMFPHLVAGPIVRASEMLPQLMRAPAIKEQDRWLGLKLVVQGYFKKVVIADTLAPMINKAFSAVVVPDSSVLWWTIVTAFAFQIYCDFSGYSDIARGLAKWMGYEFPLNFNHPYRARSLREFWTRWHISLSSWFRDYVYIPLGGGRLGEFRSHINMWVCMLLSGLWHGSSWNFILWGALHAFFLSVERLTNLSQRLQKIPGGRWIGTLIVLVEVWIGWVFFRAKTPGQAVEILKHMFGFGGRIMFGLGLTAGVFLALSIVYEMVSSVQSNKKIAGLAASANIHSILWLVMLVIACVYLRGPGVEFIYFQF